MTTYIYTAADFQAVIASPHPAVILPEAVRKMIAKLSHDVGPSIVAASGSGGTNHRNQLPGTAASTVTIRGSGFLAMRKAAKNAAAAGTTTAANATATSAATTPQPDAAESSLANIRLLLNKLTDKNFDDYSKRILRTLNLDGVAGIGATIFDMASSNVFYSQIYANLYVLIMQHHAEMRTIFDQNVRDFFARFDNITYVDSATDYDGFCRMNLEIDRRKALSMFFSHLARVGVLDRRVLVTLLQKLLQKMADALCDETKKNEIDEIREHAHILLDADSAAYLRDLAANGVELWIAMGADLLALTLLGFVRFVAGCSVKTHRGLTSKTLFTFIDMAKALL